MTHVKVVCTENGGYSLPDSSDVAPNLEQFVEVFTFKESQLANIGLKPVRIPSAKIEELKRKGKLSLVPVLLTTLAVRINPAAYPFIDFLPNPPRLFQTPRAYSKPPFI